MDAEGEESEAGNAASSADPARVRTEGEEAALAIPEGMSDFENVDENLKYVPRAEAERIQKIRDGQIFSPLLLSQFVKMRLMHHHNGHPYLHFDYPLWWDQFDRNYWKLFYKIVEEGEHLQDWEDFVRGWHLRDEDQDDRLYSPSYE